MSNGKSWAAYSPDARQHLRRRGNWQRPSRGMWLRIVERDRPHCLDAARVIANVVGRATVDWQAVACSTGTALREMLAQRDELCRDRYATRYPDGGIRREWPPGEYRTQWPDTAQRVSGGAA